MARDTAARGDGGPQLSKSKPCWVLTPILGPRAFCIKTLLHKNLNNTERGEQSLNLSAANCRVLCPVSCALPLSASSRGCDKGR